MIARSLARSRPSTVPPLGRAWICPACIGPLAAASPPSLRASPHRPLQVRQKHHVPALGKYDESFRANGVRGLFSPEGFEVAWCDYQEMLVTRINELTAGTSFEHRKPKDIVLSTARDPRAAALFNHASMAHNNHFFFSALSTAPLALPDIDHGRLRDDLEASFGSIATLRTTMIDTADAMFGPGFVWLVLLRDQASANANAFRILTTYNAGTPYPEAGYRQQGLDMNTETAATFDAYRQAQPLASVSAPPLNALGSFGPHSQAGRLAAMVPPGAPAGASLQPLLCVNTWSHVYMVNFGLTNKREYLERWWDVVDWGHVSNLMPVDTRRLGPLRATPAQPLGTRRVYGL